MTFDINDIILSKVLILEDRLAGKFRKTTCNIHVIFWLLKEGLCRSGMKASVMLAAGFFWLMRVK